jgi:aryl-phospho-beta-D-glucosidase BglC (GH1 family)
MREFIGYQRGVNLGGWFSQCDYSKERYDNFITENDLKELSTWGIDHVRLPIDYNLLEDEVGNYLDSGIAYVQKVVDWCEKYGLNLVLDLHKTFGYSFDPGEQQSGFFFEEKLQERFYKLWEHIAKHFGKYSDRVAFELLNEVTEKSYCDTWNRVSNECIKRVRVIAPDTYILVGGYGNNSVEALPSLNPPQDDKIVYNFHCYEPVLFTHQGAYWIEGMPTDFRIDYPANIEDYRKAESTMSLPILTMLEKTPTSTLGVEFFEWQFAEAVKVAEERNVPLYCGEYGVINLADVDSTLEWYKAIHTAFEKHNIARCAWSYKEMDFGLIDAHVKPIFERLKENL